MAINSFSLEYIETFRVCVSDNGVPTENATVQVTGASFGSQTKTTDSDGYAYFLATVDETLTITVSDVPGFDNQVSTFDFVFNGFGNISEEIFALTEAPNISLDSENVNFIRFNQAGNLFIESNQLGFLDGNNDYQPIETSVLGLFECKDETEIPNNYERQKRRFYNPPFYANDEVQFFLNWNVSFNGDDFSQVDLGILDNYGVLVASGLGLTEQDCDGTNYYHAEFTMPLLQFGENRFYVLYNTSSGIVYFISNPFRFEKQNKECFPLLSYRNSEDVFLNGYDCFTDKRNQHRIDFNLIDGQPEIELKQYREQGTGLLRNQKSESAKVMTVETYLFDNGANDAMLSLSIHDDIQINGKAYEVKTPHQVIANRFTKRKKGTIEFYDQEFSTINF